MQNNGHFVRERVLVPYCIVLMIIQRNLIQHLPITSVPWKRSRGKKLPSALRLTRLILGSNTLPKKFKKSSNSRPSTGSARFSSGLASPDGVRGVGGGDDETDLHKPIGWAKLTPGSSCTGLGTIFTFDSRSPPFSRALCCCRNVVINNTRQ